MVDRQTWPGGWYHPRTMHEAIFESMPVGILVTDREGRITLWNRAAEGMTGLLRDEVLGRTPEVLRKEICLEPEPVGAEVGAAEGGETSRCRIRTRAGADRVILRTSHPLFTVKGKVRGRVDTLTDITDVLHLREEVEALRGILRERDRFHDLIGRSGPMQAVYERIRLAADSNVTVNLRGESGTGKELVAAAIHYTGGRAAGSFVKVNCSALPETLLESELFGHAKGAFTGAVADRAGRFERADGGTLLIDEIGDMSPVVQLKLLRVLESKEFERLGETTPRRADVRIISASHQDLRALVGEGRFREDLFYRVNVFRIELPPLRERPEDVPLLAAHFLEKFREETGREVDGVAPDAMRLLVRHPWPGNVRELSNAIEHAFVTAKDGTIRPEDFPDEVRLGQSAPRPASSSIPARDAGRTAEAVRNALEAEQGNRERAASRLGISRVTLWKRMKQFGVTWP